jgi:chemotaxis protein MotB
LRKHRGGAWKVAYADFVTALMSLFIVLWMMNTSAVVREAVSGYFKDPKAFSQKRGSGPAGSGEGLAVTRQTAHDLQKQIEEALRRAPDFQKMRDHIQISVTGEGLRIELLETEQGMFFVTGSPNPTPSGERLIQALGEELGRMKNEIVIEGHTDSRPFRNAGPASGYGNWELSSDRANAARRLLHGFGVAPSQVVEVRGFADRKLMSPDTPDDARNRRISVVVKL